MKTLATCKPSEFLKQTNRIKRSVEKWLNVTEVFKIWRTRADLKVAPDDATVEEREKVSQENKERARKQARENISRVLDSVLEDHATETLELLALLCFVEPEDVDNHTVAEYLGAVSEMLENDEVIGFFISLNKWVQVGTSS